MDTKPLLQVVEKVKVKEKKEAGKGKRGREVSKKERREEGGEMDVWEGGKEIRKEAKK